MNDAPTTLDAMLRARVRSSPDAPLVRYRTDAGLVQDLTARQFLERIESVAAQLRGLGLASGDRVAVAVENGLDYFLLCLAAPVCDLVEVPINIEQRGPVLRHLLDDCDPACVVASEPMAEEILRCGYAGPALVHRWENGLRVEPRPSSETAPDPEALATIMYTSGTTGVSKGVMLSNAYLANLAEIVPSMMADAGPEDVYYLCTPFFHIDSRVVYTAALATGGVFAFAPKFSARGFWKDVRDFKVTFFLFIGAMLSILAKTSDPADLEDVRGQLSLATGAPIPAEAYEFFEDGLGVRLVEIFGLTEAAAITWASGPERRRGSLGRASGSYDVRVVDEQGRNVPSGVPGEVVFRPDTPGHAASGYWRNEEATRAVWRDGWFHTGDLATRDDDGFFWFVGREKDMIRRRGENISAFEVESTMSRMPGVLECAAVPTPSDLGGEDDVLLYVVPVPGQELDVAQVFEHARQNLARFAVPQWVELVPGLPHTSTGKVAKPQLDRLPGPAAVRLDPRDPSTTPSTPESQ